MNVRQIVLEVAFIFFRVSVVLFLVESFALLVFAQISRRELDYCNAFVVCLHLGVIAVCSQVASVYLDVRKLLKYF